LIEIFRNLLVNQLKFWLDPNSTGVTFIDGYDPAGPAAALDAGINSVAGVSGVICSGTVTPSVTIANSGTSALTSATINYGFDGATNLTYNWTGNLAQYQTNTVTLPSATLSSGNHTFKAIVTNPNAATDENHLNDTILSSFNTNTTGETITLSLTMDCYGDETTWTLQNNAGTITYYSGGPYAQDNGGTTVTVPMCLTPACFKFTLNDSYGDGMTSSGCPNGYYTITNASGTIVSQLLAANANFGSSINDTFCTSSTAGLGENDLQWTLYPNPAQTDVTVQIDASGEKRIVLTSTTGQIVYQSTTSENQVTIPVSNFAKGLYLVTEAAGQVRHQHRLPRRVGRVRQRDARHVGVEQFDFATLGRLDAHLE
jgi:hypothetical protein